MQVQFNESGMTVPRDILLLEDNIIIALDVEDALRELGVSEIRSALNLAQAKKHIEEKLPSFALLDVMIGSGTAFELALDLQKNGVPFVFATGYVDSDVFPESLRSVIRLQKPYSIDTLRKLFL